MKNHAHSGTLDRMSVSGPNLRKETVDSFAEVATETGNSPSELVGGRLPGADQQQDRPRETGGPAGPDPTRYGDWERAGRCIDF